ncbi:unnamed protein product [Rotaria sp. Silwood1]|nr:unnamed protein product [Rotaria sp. Silwood1]CAF3442255.1 unnamed protein product [Rotaria sp. Silwood1]CAF3463269.1 unnamed protein product [Rotaria sp. Silwood1]CAF3470489.1 unnamed protein product [Rotaria sp. Silwood1]CAF3562572.1 unnamed protein product [Rotaria sp. Silwood1]
MLFTIGRIFRRMMSSIPTSHFVTLPSRPIVQENGVISQGALKIHYWEWKGHQPTILICHGASLHSRCYDRIINEALSGFHVISLDFRGHGQSQKHPLPYPFPWFGGDLSQFIEMLDLSKNELLGIGHSLGGHALILAAALAPKQLFRSLLLLDPGIYSSYIYEEGAKNMEKFVKFAQQNNQWLSVEEMISKMDKPERLGYWPKDVLRDYCTYALDENFKLQCTSERAWHLYLTSVQSDSNIYQIIKDSKFIHNIPIHVVRAAKSITSGNIPIPPTAVDLAKWFEKGRDSQLKEGNHAFPMEKPEIMISFVKEMIDEYRNQRSHL